MTVNSSTLQAWSTPPMKLATEVATEVERAQMLFKPIYSPHEALGIIREEYIEFEKEVFRYNLAKGWDNRPEMRRELIQLAAMALRTINDVIDCPDLDKQLV